MQFAKYVKLRHEKFGAVVFDTLSEKVYVTNQSGKEILALMAEGLSVPAITQRLSAGYAQAACRIQNDVAEFVDGLKSAGLLAASVGQEP